MKHWTLAVAALLLGGCSSRGCTAGPARPDAAAARRPAPTRPPPAGDPVATVGQALLDFETQVVWPDASAPLTGGREAWATAVRQSRTPQELAATVVQLERAIGDDGMAEAWAARRDAWVASLVSPTPAALARAVRTLGESVRAGHVQARWADKHGPWNERLDAVR